MLSCACIYGLQQYGHITKISVLSFCFVSPFGSNLSTLKIEERKTKTNKRKEEIKYLRFENEMLTDLDILA